MCIREHNCALAAFILMRGARQGHYWHSIDYCRLAKMHFNLLEVKATNNHVEAETNQYLFDNLIAFGIRKLLFADYCSLLIINVYKVQKPKISVHILVTPWPPQIH